ncbi:hypothetical protein TB2_014365 [Malus domestica]
MTSWSCHSPTKRALRSSTPVILGRFCLAMMIRVVKTIDAYLGKIATCVGLSILKFNGIASLIPKGTHKVNDDLYCVIDILAQFADL